MGSLKKEFIFQKILKKFKILNKELKKDNRLLIDKNFYNKFL